MQDKCVTDRVRGGLYAQIYNPGASVTMQDKCVTDCVRGVRREMMNDVDGAAETPRGRRVVCADKQPWRECFFRAAAFQNYKLLRPKEQLVSELQPVRHESFDGQCINSEIFLTRPSKHSRQGSGRESVFYSR